MTETDVNSSAEVLLKGHPVFARLDELIEFYKYLNYTVNNFLAQGVSGVFDLNAYVFKSMRCTLQSISEILKRGRINDAYALLRKYNDVIIINIYSALYLKENMSSDNLIVSKIENWRTGDDKLPEIKNMMKYILNSEKLAGVNALIQRDDRYTKLRTRCNNHLHFNFFRYALLNESGIDKRIIKKYLDAFLTDLENLFVLHFAYTFSINEHYMMSDDYVDALECGQTPLEGSQYWVAGFVQDIFNSLIKKRRPDIANCLKSGTVMNLK